MSTLAERLFDANAAEGELDVLLEPFNIGYEYLTWDWYDCSLELKDVPSENRLSIDAQKVIFDAGFLKIYVNHLDKWETHYRPKRPEGWRVSYPEKRHDGSTSILLEENCETWPKDWFETGYVKVVNVS